jgi:hypothetical protein
MEFLISEIYNAVLNTSEAVKKDKLAVFPNPVKNILNIVSESDVKLWKSMIIWEG